MDEDVIVVDDAEGLAFAGGSSVLNGATSTESFYASSTSSRPVRASAIASTSRLRSTPGMEASDRTTRSAAARLKPQPKLKIKLSEKAAAQAPGMSFLGPYDRELDSDGDEELAFEEQFILRMPHGEDCERLKKMVGNRDVAGDVWFKFKDSRRAIFHIGNSSYSSKLVDLPCIIESQKTLDNKQMFKVADICQMLVVEKRIENDEGLAGHNKNFNIEEFIWPHGITPPLHHVRKRRFRKRVNRRTIESVEQEVERLLDEDATATQVQYEILENVNPDLSDSEFIEREDPIDAPTPALGSDAGEAATPGADLGDGSDDEDGSDEAEGDIDEDLAAELDQALEEGDDEDEEEEEEESEEEEEDDDEDEEMVQTRKLLNEEIRDLEAAVKKKEHEIASSANPLIKKRFEDALKKLTTDLDMKLAQRDEMKEQQMRKKEGIVLEDPDSEPDTGVNGEGEGDVVAVDGDLFGSDDLALRMDIG